MSNLNERRYHHGDLKNTIIETAMDMLKEGNGWEFTLREVSRRAGVSHTAPYKHFEDKSALLVELSLIGFDQLRDILTSSISNKNISLRDKFFMMAKSYIDFAHRNPSLYRLMFSAFTERAKIVHLNERSLSTLGVVIEVLEQGQIEGLIRKQNVLGQATACWAQMHGIALLSIDGLLIPEKVGPNPVENALIALLEGLELRK
ncbi:TetR/AcrR family transcriptional regulator [Acinetobacter guillouiae]|uniref:TetR/AcrR family transcriptional regulator n=1 Tax=Acinetobacter guillouiae TaxID=106649 RepID=UPI003AF498D8